MKKLYHLLCIFSHWWGGQLDPEISEAWKWIKNEKLKKPFFECLEVEIPKLIKNTKTTNAMSVPLIYILRTDCEKIKLIGIAEFQNMYVTCVTLTDWFPYFMNLHCAVHPYLILLYDFKEVFSCTNFLVAVFCILHIRSEFI